MKETLSREFLLAISKPRSQNGISKYRESNVAYLLSERNEIMNVLSHVTPHALNIITKVAKAPCKSGWDDGYFRVDTESKSVFITLPKRMTKAWRKPIEVTADKRGIVTLNRVMAALRRA